MTVIPDTAIAAAARRAGIPYNVFRRQLGLESGRMHRRPDGSLVTSSAGAQGVAQLMPGTASYLAKKYRLNPQTPYGNLLGGAYYLREQLDAFGSMREALAAYNAGPNNRGAGYGYADRILGGLGAGGGGGYAAAPTASPAPSPAGIAGGDPKKALALELIRQIGAGEHPNAALGLGAMRAAQPPSPRFSGPGGDYTGPYAAQGAPVDPGQVLQRGDFAFPVAGGAQFSDTWGAARATTGRHEGQDLFAAHGTPLLAVQDGVITKMGPSKIGGNRVWLNGRWYYAHMSAFAPGLKVGSRVRKGQVIGYVGTTGDAAGTPPHLHFGYDPTGSHGSTWANPYSILRGVTSGRR